MTFFVPHNGQPTDELVINWHLIEQCNYQCRYCFSKWAAPTSTAVIYRSKERTTRFLAQLWEAFAPATSSLMSHGRFEWSSVRLSLAGGEATLLGPRLIDICRTATQLGFDVSLISNGSLLTESYTSELAPYLAVLGLSVDSTDTVANKTIGRAQKNGEILNIDDIANVTTWARRANEDITVKINTVVSAYNAGEDFTGLLTCTRPDRWKVLRMLPVISHDGKASDDEFQRFVTRHSRHASIMSVESNTDMTQSYVMIDPSGRFFQNTPQDASYLYSGPIEELGCNAAFSQIPFDSSKFLSRYAPSGSERS
jgi:radical S-adenosyl methionine domain-containing protein 2